VINQMRPGFGPQGKDVQQDDCQGVPGRQDVAGLQLSHGALAELTAEPAAGSGITALIEAITAPNLRLSRRCIRQSHRFTGAGYKAEYLIKASPFNLVDYGHFPPRRPGTL
jgi:hypothetical protein